MADIRPKYAGAGGGAQEMPEVKPVAVDFFDTVRPGFFEQDHIRTMDPDDEYEEMILKLDDFSGTALSLTCPENIRFGFFEGDMKDLIAAVAVVDEGWPELFDEDSRIFCAFDGDRVASFCLLDNFGTWRGLKVGGPGCVGTVPAYRRQGIGLKMVQQVTEILKREEYDLSYIHYTGVAPWYAKLGYRTFLRWNSEGVIHADSAPLE